MRYEDEKNKLRKLHERINESEDTIAKMDKIQAFHFAINFYNNIFKYETDWIPIAERPDIEEE